MRSVAVEEPAQTSNRSAGPIVEKALGAWHDIEKQFDSLCIGLIAEPGPAIEAVSRILAHGRYGGPLPGAIALACHDAAFVATCLDLAGNPAWQGNVGNRAGGAGYPMAPTLPFDWPPMMIFLPADDPAIAECAHACRRMRAAGVPIRLEIMAAFHGLRTPRDVEAMATELVDELNTFFDDHLVPYFPKLL